LVPDVISIRSLLFYSQFLALQYEAAGLPAQAAQQRGRLSSAQVAAFAAHLQPVKMDLCRSVWKALSSSFRIESDFALPTIKDLVKLNESLEERVDPPPSYQTLFRHRQQLDDDLRPDSGNSDEMKDDDDKSPTNGKAGAAAHPPL
jgi:hypothetical protein